MYEDRELLVLSGRNHTGQCRCSGLETVSNTWNGQTIKVGDTIVRPNVRPHFEQTTLAWRCHFQLVRSSR